jgi:hypothetical protein
MSFGEGFLPASSSLNLFLVNVGGALLSSGLVAFARGSGGISIMNRFFAALVVGLGLRDDSSLEESSTGKALLFQLGLFCLGLGLDIVPTDDSSLDTMNNFYVPNVTVVIFDRAIYTRETGKKEGWKFKNRRFGLGRVVRSPF